MFQFGVNRNVKPLVSGRTELAASSKEESSISPDALIDQYIKPNPDKPTPDENVIVDSGVPVWAIVAHLHIVDGDIEQAAADYNLPLPAVLAAISYYHKYRPIIDARLNANEVVD